MLFNAYAAEKAGSEFKPFEYDPGDLGPEEVEIAVDACGICHSDLSVWQNEWDMTQYPLVGGHEVAGQVMAAGKNVIHRKEGDRVGLGWFSQSCMGCDQCLSGNHNLCASNAATMLGRFGGFADRVRCHWAWATPIPKVIDLLAAGPLFCGGITVFNPIVQFDVKPTDRVGVVGIGGLGHLALQFLDHWGCEVTAFTSSPAKAEEARRFGADHVVSTHEEAALEEIAGTLNFILVTSNHTLKWDQYINALAPNGRLHVVGAVLEPIPVAAFSLLMGQKSVSGSPLGSPATTARMLDFCARHDIAPQVETFPMSEINQAMAHLESGKARYRIVLENDF